jgi:hypothetical protein
MPVSDITIRSLRRIHVPTAGTWTAVASFDAAVGDFRIRNGLLKESRIDGSWMIALGEGRPDRRLTLPTGCETRERLMAAVLAKYEGGHHESR